MAVLKYGTSAQQLFILITLGIMADNKDIHA